MYLCTKYLGRYSLIWLAFQHSVVKGSYYALFQKHRYISEAAPFDLKYWKYDLYCKIDLNIFSKGWVSRAGSAVNLRIVWKQTISKSLFFKKGFLQVLREIFTNILKNDVVFRFLVDKNMLCYLKFKKNLHVFITDTTVNNISSILLTRRHRNSTL